MPANAKKRESRTAKRPRSKAAKDSVASDPSWYKDAVIYELHVRAFQDSNDDGIGDFRGLTSRLDYLQDLGITAIWLLPFYPSPLRDDGYDIADYTSIHPDYGTMRDFRRFVDEAHKRGLRVITELVINHTSDQHPWFQRARRAAPGSSARKFYVWSDTPDRFPGVRIIFQDTETSNWAWDPVARQYYWHRFFSHQPDLNFDHPPVLEAVLRVMDFWFETGVDGMRLDAIPYLFERDGTTCENLPETHDMLRALRRHLDDHWSGRMFLAEANQWPEDAVAYFGDGDECHMNFHFPLMPRLFMALRMEDRYPIIDILQQTPEIPESCQWAMFLRNHDELTLEMVTDEERDYMYRVYAQDRHMRINLGIRRRLAPLLENNRRKIELMNGLLMSLPGTPVMYYGDEIGMGDNVYLGDRDSVRTPMQWSNDRNAGFSRANPQGLFLPVIIDPGYHYETVNVESQQQTRSSLLSWMRRLLAQRARHQVMARGKIEFLHPENGKVLAFLRSNDDEDILVLANLSRFIQPAELHLGRLAGRTPVEVFGRTRFPVIGEHPYLISLAPHSFFWFKLERPEEEQAGDREPATIDITAGPSQWLRGQGLKRWIARDLGRELPYRRWFASKARTIREVGVEDVIQMKVPQPGIIDMVLVIVHVSYTTGDDELYTLPLALVDPERAGRLASVRQGVVLASVRERNGAGRWSLVDASADEAFWQTLRDMMLRRRAGKGSAGRLAGLRVSAKRHHRNGNQTPSAGGGGDESQTVRIPRAEQSNSSAIFGSSSIMKLFRRVEEGINPDVEIGTHLTRTGRFTHTPPTQGAAEYQRGKDGIMTIASMQQFVHNEGDAWRFTLDAVARFFERVLPMSERCPLPAESPLEHASATVTENESHLLDGYLDLAQLLGRRSAEMHVGLADPDDEGFSPEPITKLYLRSMYQSIRSDVQRHLQTLNGRVDQLTGRAADMAQVVLSRRPELLDGLTRIRDASLDGKRIRCHGDYHLGQVLWTGEDFFIIDFEGEPMRPIGERRLKRTCLVDVAGMRRSLHYAAFAALHELAERGLAPPPSSDGENLVQWASYWSFCAESAFLRGYLAHIGENLVPSEPENLQLLLDACTLQKAAYEVGYELNNRPDWIEIPLRGILNILGESN